MAVLWDLSARLYPSWSAAQHEGAFHSSSIVIKELEHRSEEEEEDQRRLCMEATSLWAPCGQRLLCKSQVLSKDFLAPGNAVGTCFYLATSPWYQGQSFGP